MEKKHSLLLLVVAIATLIIAVIGATFAYFANFSSVINTANITATTGNTSTFQAYSTDDITLDITSVSMQESRSSIDSVANDTATLIVELVSGNEGGEPMSCSYDIKYIWDGESLTSSEPNVESWAYDKASVVLPYKDPETSDIYNNEFSIIIDAEVVNKGNNEETTIKPFGNETETFASSKENNFTKLLGENVLEKNIITGAKISTNSSTIGAKITYIITANFYNLPINQNDLVNKMFKGHFEVNNVVC